MKARLTPLLLVLFAAALVAAGCGSDDDDTTNTGANQPAQTSPTQKGKRGKKKKSGTSAGAAQTLNVDADRSGQLRFEPDTLNAKAGEVTIVMDNPSSLPHAVGIKGDGVDEEGETVQQGDKSMATADLPAGEYQFYCPVPGHEEGGMVGTLTVE